MRRREIVAGLLAAMAFGTAQAQPAARPARIGYLALTPGEDATLMKALVERLAELGHHIGTTMTLDYRSAEGRPERLPALAAELIERRPDVLVAGFGTLAAKAAQAATATLPVVFTTVGDPVGAGLVASLARPGGNVTGLTDQATDLGGKRLQFLRDMTGRRGPVAVLMNPDTPFTRLALAEVRAASAADGTRLVVLEATKPEQVPVALEAARSEQVQGLIVFEDPLTFSQRREIATVAAKLGLPAIYGYREFAQAGGLLSYGTDRRQLYRRAAEYVDRILKGARPADLAVEQPTQFELVINLGAARAIGLEIPPALLARADELIE
jgi:putative ABC transport system substrate-binding protein